MTLTLTGIVAFLTSLVSALIVLPKLSHIAMKTGLVDVPTARKIHDIPKPLVGGIGMGIAFISSSFLFVPLSNLRGFYTGLFLILMVGLFDDYSEIHHRFKFVVQIVASLLMVYFSNTTLITFGDIIGLGPINIGTLTIPVTIFCTIGVINAINMIDGLDGLAGGISLVALSSFAVLSYINGQYELMLISLALGGAVLGFLRYNRHPASLFMGDAGSLSLGFALAFLSIAITQKENSIVPPMAPLLILAVPLTDTVVLMVKRAVKGKNPFRADKNHIHHILLKFGFSPTAIVNVIIGLTVVFSLTAIVGTVYRVADYYLFLVYCLYFISSLTIAFFIKDIYEFVRRKGIETSGLTLVQFIRKILTSKGDHQKYRSD